MAQLKQSALYLDDVDSRLWLQTKTQSGQNWDQVVGVSQRIINKNFRRLADLYPNMLDMYSSVDSYGTIDAKLKSIEVLIPGGGSNVSRSEVLLQLEFESGYMSDPNGQSLIEDMTGWVITVPIKVDSVKAEINPSKMSAATIEATKKKNKWIDTFDVAGDYSAERIFVKFTSIAWHGFDKDLTSCGLDKDNQPIPFDDWANEDSSRFIRFTSWLQEWSHRQDAAGRNNLGLSIKEMPTITEEQSNYRPIFMMNQTYPYRSNPQQAIDGATGRTGAAECNAYLYTEIVSIPGLSDSRRPDDHTLVWSGNFCTLPKAPDDASAIDGTFVLGRNVFLETFLLPELRPLNKAFDICHKDPYGVEQSDGRITCYTPYHLGKDQKHPDLTDDVFKWSSVNEANDPDRVNGYRWEKTNIRGPVIVYNSNSDKHDLQSKTEAMDIMRIDVTWEPGTSRLKVSGLATSKEDDLWNNGKRDDWKDLWAWVRDEYVVTFDFALELKIDEGLNKNGILDVYVVGGNENTNIKVTWKKNQHHIVDQGHVDDFKNDLESNFKAVIPGAIDNVRKKLQRSGRFVFPGNGVFDFSKPMMSRYGHLLARVDYKALELNEKLFVPRPPKLETRVNVVAPERLPKKAADVGKFQLDWHPPASPLPAALKKTKVVLRGTNLDPSLWCEFKQITIQFTSSTKAAALFAEDLWKAASTVDVPAPVKEPSATGTSISKTTDAPASMTRDLEADAVLVERPTQTAQPDQGKLGAVLSSISSAFSSSKDALPSPRTPELPPSAPPAPTAPISKPKPTPSGPAGIVTMRSKISYKEQAILKAVSKAGPKWNIVLDTVGVDGVLRMGPGDWIEVELDGVVGPAGNYTFVVNEEWNEKETSYFKSDVKLGIAAAE